MELINFVIDFILHVDRYIETFVQNNGAWVYALLFVIVFVETGLVIMPFLPGDSLLFIVGALCGAGMMNLPLALGLLWVAAILGDQCNYLVANIWVNGFCKRLSRDGSIEKPMTARTIFMSNTAPSPL